MLACFWPETQDSRVLSLIPARTVEMDGSYSGSWTASPTTAAPTAVPTSKAPTTNWTLPIGHTNDTSFVATVLAYGVQAATNCTFGCTDAAMANYNRSANADDGSCRPVEPLHAPYFAYKAVNNTDTLHIRARKALDNKDTLHIFRII